MRAYASITTVSSPLMLVRGAALVLVLVLATGCGTSRVAAPVDVPGSASIALDADELESQLRSEVRSWEGTPHRWGGETRAGADCSGFVMRVYQDALGLTLPRTTEDQARVGRAISEDVLAPGDLVFFRTAPKTRHVGVYLSDGEFAHASTSGGVRISALDEDYWQRTYWMSRRVLSNSRPVAMRPSVADSPPASPGYNTASPDPENPGDPRLGW